MDQIKRKEATDEIRQLIAINKFEDALKALLALSEKINVDFRDATLTVISAFNQFEADLRQGMLDPSQASAKRVRIVDQILDLSRDIERGAQKPGYVLGVALPPEEKEDEPQRSGNIAQQFIIIFLSLIGIVGFSFYFIFNFDGDDAGIAQQDECKKYFKAGLKAYLDDDPEKAIGYFTIVKSECPEHPDIDRWLNHINGTNQALAEIDSLEQIIVDSGQTVPKGIDDESDSLPKSKNSAILYDRWLNKGKQFLADGYPVQAIKSFEKAASSENTEEAAKLLDQAKQEAHNHYLNVGIDLFNQKDFEDAKTAIEHALQYRESVSARNWLRKIGDQKMKEED